MNKSKRAIQKTIAHLNKANRKDLVKELKAKPQTAYHETIKLCRSYLDLAYNRQ